VLGVALPNTVEPVLRGNAPEFPRQRREQRVRRQVAIANDSDSNQLSRSMDSFSKVSAPLPSTPSTPGRCRERCGVEPAGIPVFSVNVIISPDDLKTQNARVVQYVGADQPEGGKAMGEQLLKDVGANAKIVAGIVGDPDQIPTNQRDQGFPMRSSPTLGQGRSDGEQQGGPQRQPAGHDGHAAGNPDINVVFADTGPGTVGALQAINQLGKAGKSLSTGSVPPINRSTPRIGRAPRRNRPTMRGSSWRTSIHTSAVPRSPRRLSR